MNRLGRRSFFLVPTVLRGNPYLGSLGKIGMQSHGGPWERVPWYAVRTTVNPTDVNQANVI